MNHQPCRESAIASTQMSRHLSSATSHIHLANIRLEDLIVDELELGIVQPHAVEPLIGHLREAAADFSKASSVARTMDEALRVSNFIDCKDPQKLATIAKRLADQRMLDPHHAGAVELDRSKGGFLACLARIQEGFGQCEMLTRQLCDAFHTLQSRMQAEEKAFDHLEFNTPESIKPAFAMLFAAVGALNGYFLASAIVSTEIFYAVAGLGRLGEPVIHQNLGEVHSHFSRPGAMAELAGVGLR